MTGVLVHVQHLLGIGHLKRAAILARTLARGGFDVTFLSGGPPAADLDLGGASLVQLPPARARDASFGLIDAQGLPLDSAFHRRRTELVLAAFSRAKPQIVVIESYPFGRRAFRPELDALVAAARAAEPLAAVLASIRDILVRKEDPKRAAEIVARVRRDFDAVLVHGDPRLVPLEASFPAAGEIADRLRYTGYIIDGARQESGRAGEGEVIVSAGGGAAGERLLRAALAARPLTALASQPWRLVGGANLPERAFEALAAHRAAGVVVERQRADLPALLRRCRLSISQGGYNTVLDVLQAGVPAVIVPFADGGETEQTQRARVLAALGAVHWVAERDLDRPAPGAGLAGAIATALLAGRPAPLALALDGARRSVELVAEFAAQASARR